MFADGGLRGDPRWTTTTFRTLAARVSRSARDALDLGGGGRRCARCCARCCARRRAGRRQRRWRRKPSALLPSTFARPTLGGFSIGGG